MSWEDVQDAVHEAITRASGYPAEKVIWSYQSTNERSLAHVRINFGGESVIGQDRIKTTTDLTRPAGQEIKQEVIGVREVPLDVEVFTSETVGANAARHVAAQIRTKIQLDSIRGVLKSANVSCFDSGPVSWVPDIPAVSFRGRALVTLKCYVPISDCEEYTGYIARVTGTMTVSGFFVASGATGVFATGTREYTYDTLRASGASGGGP
jgi:hypothetical protein